MTTSFKSSGNLGTGKTTGELFQANGDFVYSRDNEGREVFARGLVLTVTPPSNGTIGTWAATLVLEVGRPSGGGRARRRITLTPRGVWISAVGWETIRVSVELKDAASIVSYAWTREQPPAGFPLLLVEQIAAGVGQVPPGAARVAVATADAGWIWRTQVASLPALDLPTGIAAGGELRPVLGSAYVSTGPNVLSWELDPL